jgi:hypothetical protein
MKNYLPVIAKLEKMPKITKRSMFGYQCYSINKKFFVGFSNKNYYQMIVRLPKDQQVEAVKIKAIRPFSHGAKAGWIEIDSKSTTVAVAMKWVMTGFERAKRLSKK